MNDKWKYIITGLFSAILAVFIYMTLRIDRLEQDHIQGLKHSTSDIVEFYSREMKKSSSGAGRSMDPAEIAGKISSGYPDIALLLISDMSGRIKITSKNDKYIRTASMYDQILSDYTDGKYKTVSKSGYLVRYYDVKRQDRPDQYKFYIFIRNVQKDRLCIVYPYNPGNVMVTRIGLEISLILILITVITTFLYILSRKKGMPVASAETVEQGVPTEIDTSQRTMEREDRQYLKNSTNLSVETLQQCVYDLFNRIHNEHAPELLSLYIHEGGELLHKKYEMKGRSFISYDADTFDTISLDNQTGREILKGSVLVLENSSKVILPLLQESHLIGVIIMLRKEGFTGTEVDGIREKAASLAAPVNDFLAMNRVMTDPGTGLYSKAFFTMKYNEYLHMNEEGQIDFALVFLDPGCMPGPDTKKEYENIIRIITPAIADICKNDDHICIYDDTVAILMAGTGNDKAVEKAEKILETLSKIRVRINSERVIQVIPGMGLAASDSVTELSTLLRSAQKNMELARETGHASLKASRIRKQTRTDLT